jgi:hypothetical protein
VAVLVSGAAAAATVVAGCGSDDKKGREVSADANGTGGNGFVLDPDGGVVAATDGGSVELTAEQVEAIENSACAGWAGEGELLPAVLQLVVDVSGSMTQDAPGSNDSKWEITHDALVDAIGALSADTAVGILLYPNYGDRTGTGVEPRPVDACVATDDLLGIDLLGGTGAAHRSAVVNLLDGANVGGGTPTHDAYQYALEQSLVPFVTDLDKYMLLITDGEPTYSHACIGTGYVTDAVDPQPIIDMVEQAHDEHGIRTFVIGSPGSEVSQGSGEDTRWWLSEAAQLGGTGEPGCQINGPEYCHMDMTESPDFSQALRDGLAQVIGQIGQCTYALPTPPAGETLDLGAVNLIIHTTNGAKLVLPDNQGDCSEGWQFDADDNVVLCEATCAELEGDTEARVELLFGCISGEIPEIQ